MPRVKTILGLAFFWTFFATAWAAIPQLINFQGILKDGSGNPVANGSYSVTFTIYDAPTGGTNLWTETQSVTTSGGLFAVLLGSSNPVPDAIFQGSERWLGIAVSPDPELTPRQKLVSVGYAYRVSSVDSASGGTITSKVSIGLGHTNTGNDAFVAGTTNQVTANYTAVGGGALNNATNESSVISGGQQNTASGFASSVSGGASNTASNTYSNVGGGLYNTSSGFWSVVDGGQLNTATGEGAVVDGGGYNYARGRYSTVGGGGGAATDSNSALGDNSTISGGYANRASLSGSTVGGGGSNHADGYVSTVSGGRDNTASGFSSTVGGGTDNVASGQDNTVGGGHANTTGGLLEATVSGGGFNVASADHSTVAGGRFNRARGEFSVVSGGGGSALADSNSAQGAGSSIGGGRRNTVTGIFSTVGGGHSNAASANYGTVSGGLFNTAAEAYTTVAGGNSNNATVFRATVSGGQDNDATDTASTVGGGFINWASGAFSTVSGGGGNTASGRESTVGGGGGNTASDQQATVGGGGNNQANGFAATVIGGSSNMASGSQATVLGGEFNVAAGDFSLAAGQRAKANHNGAFVWGDLTAADFASTATNQFLIRASGGVGIGTNSPSGIASDRTTLHVAGSSTPAYVLEQTGTDPRKWILFTSGINGSLILRDETVVQTRLQIGTNGNVGIGTNPNFGDPSFKLDVRDSAAAVAAFDRRGDDGNVIEIKQAGTTEGIISVSGNTVTYGAFTGSHYGWTEETLERGELVTLTGINRNSHDNPKSEIIYGIRRSTEPNDPACLGSYFALSESSKPYSSENPHLVMAVGNGDMWVVDEGQNIQPGDYLISSSTPGHAMKDDEGKYPIGHIVARAAEAVDWSGVSETLGSHKHKKISVLFGNFVRSIPANMYRTTKQQGEIIKLQKKELDELKARLLKLEEKSPRAQMEK